MERLVVIPLLGFASWTLACHMTLLLDGSFLDLARWSWLIVPAIPVLYRLIGATAPAPPPPEPPPGDTRPQQWRMFFILLAVILLLDAIQIYFPNRNYQLFWVLAMLVLGRAWLTERHATGWRPAPLPDMTRQEQWVFLPLVALVLLVTLLAHRPDNDEQFYTNLAVMTLEHPERPLLSWNGMLWNQGESAWLPVDRLTAIEPLWALLASLSNMEPIAVSHLLFAPLFALWTLLIQGLLLRHFIPRFWLAGLILVIFLLFAIGGETGGSYSVYAFLMIHYGKTTLMAGLLPLLFFLGLRFARTGWRRDWLLLLLGNAAAVGFSTSGLFLAPFATGMGLVANWRPRLDDTKRLLVGVGSCIYPLGIGLWMRGLMIDTMDTIPWNPMHLHANITKVIGAEQERWFYLAAILGAWSLMSDPRLRRTLLGISFFFAAIFFNPFLHPILMAHLTGAFTTWRLLFTIPAPIMAALMLLSISGMTRAGQRPVTPLALLAVLTPMLLLSSLHPDWRAFWSIPAGYALWALLALATLEFLPRLAPLRPLLILVPVLLFLTHFQFHAQGNRTVLAPPRTQFRFPPGIKEPVTELAAARQAVALTPRDHSALLPLPVARVTAALRHAPLQIATEEIYIELLNRWLEPDAQTNRVALSQYVSGQARSPDAPQRLTRTITTHRIGLVASSRTNPWLAEIDATLQPFQPTQTIREGHVFWSLPASPGLTPP
ncbi:MAG: hypothetical protein HQL96_04290 [Magnetococcales bacterium]|nr:hypothetical protein [Magnetococcales bacterium]